MAKTEYKAPLRGFALIILKLLVRFTTAFTDRIKDVEVRLMADGLLKGSQEVMRVLSDTDPDDKEQLRAVVNKILSEGEFRQGATAELNQKISKLSNEDVRFLLSIVNNESFDIAGLLTDTNEDNSAQMAEHLQGLIRSEDGILFLRSFLGLLLKDDQLADTVAVIIIELLISNLADEGDVSQVDFSERLSHIQDTYHRRSLVA